MEHRFAEVGAEDRIVLEGKVVRREAGVGAGVDDRRREADPEVVGVAGGVGQNPRRGRVVAHLLRDVYGADEADVGLGRWRAGAVVVVRARRHDRRRVVRARVGAEEELDPSVPRLGGRRARVLRLLRDARHVVAPPARLNPRGVDPVLVLEDLPDDLRAVPRVRDGDLVGCGDSNVALEHEVGLRVRREHLRGGGDMSAAVGDRRVRAALRAQSERREGESHAVVVAEPH